MEPASYNPYRSYTKNLKLRSIIINIAMFLEKVKKLP